MRLTYSIPRPMSSRSFKMPCTPSSRTDLGFLPLPLLPFESHNSANVIEGRHSDDRSCTGTECFVENRLPCLDWTVPGHTAVQSFLKNVGLRTSKLISCESAPG